MITVMSSLLTFSTVSVYLFVCDFREVVRHGDEQGLSGTRRDGGR